MDWIDVLWTIAITEALLLRGGIFFVFCFSSQGFHSPCRLISSLFLFFLVSVLQRMTANYSAESHIGASKSKGGERSERAAGCCQELCERQALWKP